MSRELGGKCNEEDGDFGDEDDDETMVSLGFSFSAKKSTVGQNTLENHSF